MSRNKTTLVSHDALRQAQGERVLSGARAHCLDYDAVMQRLRALGQSEALAGMARFGINTANAYGISVTTLRKLAREVGRDHGLAGQLWSSGVHEARMLASMVEDPKLATEAQMDAWAADFDSWDVCDTCCFGLFDRTPFAYAKALAWSSREEEFIKRAGFALMAGLAVHDKKASDEQFEPFFPAIVAGATDQRNFVRKAVNWALRQIGKRSPGLNRRAIETAERIAALDVRSARWIASDALRELTSVAVQQRLQCRVGV